jgi:aspartate aminotransferase-like enzyme
MTACVGRREFITLLAVTAAALAGPGARAQQAGKIPRVGFMGNSTAALEANLVGPFRDGLRELGYQKAAISSSSTDGRTESESAFPLLSPNYLPCRWM